MRVSASSLDARCVFVVLPLCSITNAALAGKTMRCAKTVASILIIGSLTACSRFNAGPALPSRSPAQKLATTPQISKYDTGPIHPIPGNGMGGAFGPVKISSLASLSNRGIFPTRIVPPAPRVSNLTDPSLFNSPIQRRTSDASSTDSSGVNFTTSPSFKVSSSFDSYNAIDVGGAGNGTYVVTTNEYGDVHVYSPAGSLLQFLLYPAIYCGTNPLPVCSTPGGYNGDGRVEYDAGSARWIMTGLWIKSSPVQDVLAVSQSSNPLGGWYLYQFPACGAYDTWDGSDQPHTGFNGQWVATTSLCGVDPNDSSQVGAGLAVFEKSALYAGQALALNKNWFEFEDPVELAENRDNPVSSYVSAAASPLYLTASGISLGHAAAIYSIISGATTAPVFYSKAEQVTTSFAATSPPALSAPGCSSCITSFAFGWSHSSSMFTFKNGQAYVLTTFVLGNPNIASSTQIVNIALSSATGNGNALQLLGAPGAGPLASEISMALPQNYTYDAVSIAWDATTSKFYPGVKFALWNADSNAQVYSKPLQQGTLTPASDDASRWTDFMDAMTPVPGTSQLLVGGTVARPSTGSSGYDDPYRSTYYATVTP